MAASVDTSDLTTRLDQLADAASAELTGHILPYWAERTPDDVHGGFVGRIDGHDQLVPDSPKGAVLGARILWTFAVSARVLDDADGAYRQLADRAYEYLRDHFRDGEHGGVFWMVTADGQPLDTKKQTYAQAFAVYALAEYAALTGDAEPLEWAQELFRWIEARTVDPEHGGYFEALSRNGGPLADVRLSAKDADAPKSMNTHLHIMEAYATLYRLWPDAELGRRLRATIEIFLDRIVTADGRSMICFFDANWTPVSRSASFGHDIEASWLLDEAAETLGDPALADRVRQSSVSLARAVLADGVDADGGLFNEAENGSVTDADKHWWPQAEAVIGFLNAFEYTGEPAFAYAALDAWAFVECHIVDSEGGEWFFRVSRDGVPYRDEDKVGPWKCPYHNARACVEIAQRVGALQAA